MKELKKSILSDTHFKQLADNSVDMIYRLTPTDDFIYVNLAATKLTGYTEEELLAMNFMDLVQQEYKNSTLKFYAAQVTEQQSSYFEIPLVRKDGKLVWIGQQVNIETESGGTQKTG